jgi:hypothetical protein
MRVPYRVELIEFGELVDTLSPGEGAPGAIIPGGENKTGGSGFKSPWGVVFVILEFFPILFTCTR